MTWDGTILPQIDDQTFADFSRSPVWEWGVNQLSPQAIPGKRKLPVADLPRSWNGPCLLLEKSFSYAFVDLRRGDGDHAGGRFLQQIPRRAIIRSYRPSGMSMPEQEVDRADVSRPAPAASNGLRGFVQKRHKPKTQKCGKTHILDGMAQKEAPNCLSAMAKTSAKTNSSSELCKTFCARLSAQPFVYFLKMEP